MTVRTLDLTEEILILEKLDIDNHVKDEHGFSLLDVKQTPTTFKRLRNVLAYILMLDAGLRVGEVVKLLVSDCYFNNEPVKTLLIPSYCSHAKTDREIPVTPRLNIALLRFSRNYFLLPDCLITQSLICNKLYGDALTTRSLERIITSAAERSIGRPVNPHVLRHTFATKLMKIADIRTVQELLGHKSVQSTQIYTHPGTAEKNDAIAKLNSPLDGLINGRPLHGPLNR